MLSLYCSHHKTWSKHLMMLIVCVFHVLISVHLKWWSWDSYCFSFHDILGYGAGIHRVKIKNISFTCSSKEDDRPNGNRKRWVLSSLPAQQNQAVEVFHSLSRERSSARSQHRSEAPHGKWYRDLGIFRFLFFKKRKRKRKLATCCQGFGFIFDLKLFVPIVILTVSGMPVLIAKLLMLKLGRNGTKPPVLFGSALFLELLWPQRRITSSTTSGRNPFGLLWLFWSV